MSFTVSDVKGAITPLVTPFHPDGALDLESVGRLIDWQLERGTHGISVGGSTGEPTSQTVAERIEVMRTAVAAIDGRVPFLPGTGTARLDETFELTAEAQSLGAPAALVVAPYYARPTQQGLFEWYSRIATEFPDMPILVYNVPIRSAVDITPETVGRLRRAHENIVAVLESEQRLTHLLVASRLVPEFEWGERREMHFLPAAFVHLFTNNPLDVPLNAPPNRREAVESGRQRCHEPGTQEQLMASQFRFGRCVSQGLQHELAHSHDGEPPACSN